MKRKISLLLTLSLITLSTFASNLRDNTEYYDVNRNDAGSSRYSYRPGEVIIKLKKQGTRSATLKTTRSGVTASGATSELSGLLKKYGASETEELMPLTGAIVTPKSTRAKDHNGNEVADPDNSTLYLLRLDQTKADNIETIVKEFSDIPEVEYAEPNYIVRICSTDYTSDPMYSQQWGIPAIGLDKLWNAPLINTKRPVIAILDTGVDIEHPDLAANIWTNSREADGSANFDDDGNGFTDDIHGWDFVNQSPRMRDNNGHGTHCAGIAAAVGGNGIGITGANPDAMIMPITVMQSDGTGDIGTIIHGIDYAVANGADVLSMSFGGYSHSMAEYDALAKAYQKAVLVAAAGNDCIDIEVSPMFPAAYNFVIGVTASDENNSKAIFSNADSNGPLLSGYNSEQLYNYDIMAPGTNVVSTYPGGGYKSLNGTSMACPLAAGAISRLYQCKDIPNKEILLADLIQTLKDGIMGVIDIEAAYNLSESEKNPLLSMVSYRFEDSRGDNDLRMDAGEKIDFYPTIRNFRGHAKNIKVKISLGENEDPDIVEFIKPEIDFGSELDSYALNESNIPLSFKVNENCVDGRHIRFLISATCDNIEEVFQQEFVLTAENGIELGGIIGKDMTLYPDKHYIITSMLGIPDGVTLTLMPGTILKFHDNTGLLVSPNSKIIAVGTPENRIIFTKADLAQGNIESVNLGSSSILKYCEIRDLKMGSWSSDISEKLIFTNCDVESIYSNSDLSSCILYTNNRVTSVSYPTNSTFVRNISGTGSFPYIEQIKQTSTGDLFEGDGIKSGNTFGNYKDYGDKRWYYSTGFSAGTPGIKKVNANYLGSNDESILRYWVWDIKHPYNNTMFGSYVQLDLSTRLNRPNHEAPGCVWKVVVDGYDAQDQFTMLPDLGVGRHKFEVYFSKQMNRKKIPLIAMGVRPPYTQTAIADDGSWRSETMENGDVIDIYTAYLTIKGGDKYDGLNRIYVGDAEDIEYFPCPIEDFRYNVNVQSAGAMSTGFTAEAGVGKVTLKWENPEENFDDMLGYNMYRYTLDENEVAGDTIRINEKLLDKEELVDYDIEPGKTYCYYYKVLRTSLDENAPSRVVAATPRAAGKGDADASGDVDVADVVTEVNYMVGRDPKPFMFEAADINEDNEIDILDVVGTVNIIMKPKAASSIMSVQSEAVYTIENGILYVESPVDIAGMQVEITGDRNANAIKALDGVLGMETTGAWLSDKDYCMIAFSLSGKSIGSGRQAIAEIGEADVESLILVDASGSRIAVRRNVTSGISDISESENKRNAVYPNPFDEVLNVLLNIDTAGNHDVKISLTNIAGSTVMSTRRTLGEGEHTVTLNTAHLTQGLYIVTLTVDGKTIESLKAFKK